MSRANFAFAQARLHARLERRLTEADWSTLAGSRNFGSCLDVLSQTAAANVVSRLDRTYSVHAVERVLREEWAAFVYEISCWLPKSWHHATQWLVLLPHLRRFEYSAGNGDTPRWLRLNTEFGELVNVMQSEESGGSSTPTVANIWRNEWHNRLPDFRHHGALNTALAPLLSRYLETATNTFGETPQSLQKLSDNLKGLFRSHAQRPIAIFAYLGLVAFDFERLRGVLVDRILFSQTFEAEEV